MRHRSGPIALVVGLLAVAGCGGGARTTAHQGADHRSRIEAGGDRDRGRETGVNSPNARAYEDRAYPKRYQTAAQTLAARRAYKRLPRRLDRAAFRPGARAQAVTSVGADWQFIGPDVGFAPGPTTESLRDSITSGRITGMAIDPNCGSPGHGCRLWVAAAGGGIWRSSDALSAAPHWTVADSGLPTNNLGSIVVDPTDGSGDTLYAGTGEANAINASGAGLYKSTDGGGHWALVPGSFAVSHDRSIGAIRIDPNDPDTIWMGTALGRTGQSSTNGGAVEPPDAPELGVYRSTDGGRSFQLQFSLPQDLFVGGVNDIELDPNDSASVYASLFGHGVWRTTGGDWEQVYVPQVPEGDDRAEIALADRGATTRAYVMDGGTDVVNDEFVATGDIFRVDDVAAPAAALVGPGGDNAGWTRLSSSTDGDPGYAVHQPCQFQCSYDMFLEVDPTNPDVVWEGGSMVYEEIRPLQDASLRGLASNRSNGRAVMRSTDGGVHWTDMTADTRTPHYEQMHPDQHALVFAPGNPDVAIVGSDGGVVRTDGTYDDASGSCATRDGVAGSATDAADCEQWLSRVPHEIVNMNAGLATLQFTSLSVDPRDALGDLLGGTQDNGTFAYSPPAAGQPRSWFESVNGDGAASGFDAADPAVRVHTFFTGLIDVNHRGADPHYWTFISQPLVDSGENASFYLPLQTDPVVSGTIFAGQQHVWRTKDDGGPQASLEAHCLGPGGVPTYDPQKTKCGNFEAIGPDLTSPALGSRTDDLDYVVFLRRAPSDARTLWVAGRRGRLFISHNADAPAAHVAFERIDSGQSPGRFPSGIAVDPADADHAFVSYSGYGQNTPSTPGHVYEVRFDPATGGATFTDRSYDLADQPITAIALDDMTGDLYGGTDNGVVRLPAGATKWEQAAAGFPPATTPGLTLASSGRALYAATYGRSAYRLALPPAARISGPASVAEGQAAVFDGRGSRVYGDAAPSYRWTLPDGSTASGPTVAWTAHGAGTRTVSLTVTEPGAGGRSGTASRTVAVTPAPATGGATSGRGRVRLARRQVRLHGRVLRLVLTCPRTQPLGCSGRATASMRLGGRTVRLGSVRFTIRAGARKTISLRLRRSVVGALGRHSHAVTVRIAQRGQPETQLKLRMRR